MLGSKLDDVDSILNEIFPLKVVAPYKQPRSRVICIWYSLDLTNSHFWSKQVMTCTDCGENSFGFHLPQHAIAQAAGPKESQLKAEINTKHGLFPAHPQSSNHWHCTTFKFKQRLIIKRLWFFIMILNIQISKSKCECLPRLCHFLSDMEILAQF